LGQEEDGIFWRSESFMPQSNGLQSSGRGKIVKKFEIPKSCVKRDLKMRPDILYTRFKDGGCVGVGVGAGGGGRVGAVAGAGGRVGAVAGGGAEVGVGVIFETMHSTDTD